MDIGLSGIVIIVGNYGSGKTEVAINLAVACIGCGMVVRLADLDLVNPYFRTREARAALGALGVQLLLPDKDYLDADLPILSPAIAGAIRQPDPAGVTLLDVGGDGAGAMVLAALGDALGERPRRMLQVINPFRPLTNSIDGCLRIRAEIERASGIAVSGLIGNAHLIDETTAADIRWGHDQVEALARFSGLPLVFMTVPQHLADEMHPQEFSCPVLPIRRQLVPPWKTASRLPPPGGSYRPPLCGLPVPGGRK